MRRTQRGRHPRRPLTARQLASYRKGMALVIAILIIFYLGSVCLVWSFEVLLTAEAARRQAWTVECGSLSRATFNDLGSACQVLAMRFGAGFQGMFNDRGPVVIRDPETGEVTEIPPDVSGREMKEQLMPLFPVYYPLEFRGATIAPQNGDPGLKELFSRMTGKAMVVIYFDGIRKASEVGLAPSAVLSQNVIQCTMMVHYKIKMNAQPVPEEGNLTNVLNSAWRPIKYQADADLDPRVSFNEDSWPDLPGGIPRKTGDQTLQRPGKEPGNPPKSTPRRRPKALLGESQYSTTAQLTFFIGLAKPANEGPYPAFRPGAELDTCNAKSEAQVGCNTDLESGGGCPEGHNVVSNDCGTFPGTFKTAGDAQKAANGVNSPLGNLSQTLRFLFEQGRYTPPPVSNAQRARIINGLAFHPPYKPGQWKSIKDSRQPWVLPGDPTVPPLPPTKIPATSNINQIVVKFQPFTPLLPGPFEF